MNRLTVLENKIAKYNSIMTKKKNEGKCTNNEEVIIQTLCFRYNKLKRETEEKKLAKFINDNK